MADQLKKVEQFRALHVRGTPWFSSTSGTQAAPRPSLRPVPKRSRPAAGRSMPTASPMGTMPLPVAIDNLRRIVGVTDLPVTVDSRAAMAIRPKMVGETIRLAIEAGAVGCNLEDSFPANGKLRDPVISAIASDARRKRPMLLESLSSSMLGQMSSSNSRPSSMSTRWSSRHSSEPAHMRPQGPTGSSRQG